MLDSKSSSWFYPKPTADPGRDRNARTLQFACLLLAFAVGLITVLDFIEHEPDETPLLACALAGLILAVFLNHAGRWALAAGTAFLAMLLTAFLLVFEARDGFRSLAMPIFPGLLLVSVMLLNRALYLTTAGIVLVAVAALGIAEKHGLTRAIPGVRTPTSYESIFYVDLNLLVFAAIGSRIARDAQNNVVDLRTTIDRLSSANLELTERAEAWRASEQQQVSIYETVKDVIFLLAAEPEGRFRFVSVNPAFLRVTGLSREAVIGKTVNEVIPEPSLTTVLGKYWQAIEENTTVVWEETSDYPTGRLTGRVSVAPVFDSKGTCTNLVGSVHDITEYKRAVEDQRKALEQLHLITDNMAAGVTRCSRDLRYLWVSPNYAAWLGLTPAEIAGRPILDVIGEEGYEGIRPHVERVLSGEREEYEAQVNYRGASLRWIRAVYVPTRGQEHEVDGWIEVVTDVTDVRRTQAESFARQKLESIGTLAGGIAHDFNNLMASVLAEAELAQAELAAGSRPEQELKSICKVALRGSEIVRQLMVYAGNESAVVGPVDVSRTVSEMVQLLRVGVTKHAVLEMDLGTDLPSVQADAAQLQQIVMNLVTNASDAIGDRDGVIRVTTRRVTLTSKLTAVSGTLPEGDYLSLEVSDTGCGMSRETQAKVFDPFFTTKFAGRGLGLAVVSGVVRSLGGTIHVTSEEGKGATFQVLLPCAKSTNDASGDAMSAVG
jgi:PAS domain S-box-containing protein